MLRVLERQLFAGGTDETRGPGDDAVWILPLSDVVEVLADLLHGQVRPDVNRVGLHHETATVLLYQVDDAHLGPFTHRTATAFIAHLLYIVAFKTPYVDHA